MGLLILLMGGGYLVYRWVHKNTEPSGEPSMRARTPETPSVSGGDGPPAP